LLEKGYTPDVIRYLLTSVPYRKKLNFTFDGLKAAATSLERLRNYKLRLQKGAFPDETNDTILERTREAREQLDAAMDDDLNTAEALGAVFEFVRDSNSAMDAGGFGKANAKAALEFLEHFDSIFDVLRAVEKEGGLADDAIDALVAERTAAKKARDFQRADEIRHELTAQGIILEDTRDGVRWKRK
jgi:cysteinyl-tRNA synthetase